MISSMQPAWFAELHARLITTDSWATHLLPRITVHQSECSLCEARSPQRPQVELAYADAADHFIDFHDNGEGL